MVCFPLGRADEAQELELRHSPVEACVQAWINRGPILFPTFNDRQPALREKYSLIRKLQLLFLEED